MAFSMKFKANGNYPDLDIPILNAYIDLQRTRYALGNSSNPVTLYDNYIYNWHPLIERKIGTFINGETLETRTYTHPTNDNITLEIIYRGIVSTNFPSYLIIQTSVTLKHKTLGSNYLTGSYIYYSNNINNFTPILIVDTKNKILAEFVSQDTNLVDIYPRNEQINLSRTDVSLWTGSKNRAFKGLYNKEIPADQQRLFNGNIFNINQRVTSDSIGYNLHYDSGCRFTISSIIFSKLGYELDDIQQTYDEFFKDYTIPTYPNNTDDQGSNPDGTDPDTGNPNGTTNYDPTDTSPSNADNTSDDIFSPSKPAQGVTNTGFVTVYNPSITEIQSLASFMWSAEIPDLLKKIFNEPLDAIIDLKLLYAPVTTANRQTIWLGVTETNTSSLRVTQQFTEFDCGSIDVATYFQSFLDYAPYTKISIYLPFIGYRELNTDEVMDSIINLKYMIDVFSGSCVAIITLTKTVGSTQLNSVMYQFDGNCSMEIPFTSLNMQQYIGAVLNVASATAQAVTAGQAVMSTPEPGRYSKTTKAEWASVNKNFEQSLSNLGNTGLDLISTKPRVSRAGSLAGANASMAVKQAYLIIERPMQQMPTDYAHFMGIPLNLTKRLSTMRGFTVVSDIQFRSAIATDEEHEIVVGLLKQGVIF